MQISKIALKNAHTYYVRWDAFLILDLGFHVVDRVAGLHVKRDGLSRQSLDEDLHTAAETKNQVQSGLFLNVVVRKSAPVFELFTGKDQSLLVIFLVKCVCFARTYRKLVF